jgi:hypothetical protein
MVALLSTQGANGNLQTWMLAGATVIALALNRNP